MIAEFFCNHTNDPSGIIWENSINRKKSTLRFPRRRLFWSEREGKTMGFHFKGKKKALVLFASPNSQGHTRKLLEGFLRDFREDQDWMIEEINVYEKNLHPCIGCKACAKKEGCAFDDFDEIDHALRQSDLLVIASPIYSASFPSPMKALLDRTQRYFEARFSLGLKPPIKKHRKAVLLLSMGSREDFGVEVATYQLQRAFTVMNTELCGCAVWQETDRGEERKGEALRAAQALALEIRGKI